MSVLLDTNILTRSSEPRHPLHRFAVDAVAALLQHGEDVFLVPQNFYEFWSVVTRPVAQNGLGLSTSQAAVEVARLHADFSVLADLPAVLPVWEQLVAQHQVAGKSAHDAHLVAAMLVHGIDRLLTFDKADFARYQQIIAISPEDVVGPATTP
jgi:predicted nucleic acid-binding protein